ncbi:MAG: hypothetical protein AAF532_07655 [Planctomycetota bacterium]
MKNKLIRIITATACITAIAATSGCVEVPPNEGRAAFESESLDIALTVVIDLSGSFSHTWDAAGFAHFQQLTDLFFRESLGAESRLTIGQLSGNTQTMIWEGSGHDLRRSFQSPADFANFVKASIAAADRGSSPVSQSIANAIRYVEGTPNLTPRTRKLTVLYSDLMDTGSSEEDERDMLETLKRYTESGGGIALYYAEPSVRPVYLQKFANAGLNPRSYCVETRLVARPPLPSFD